MDESPIRVVLADDSVLFREGLARVFAEHGFILAGQAGDADELVKVVAQVMRDVVVTDVRMPPTSSLEGILAALRIRDEHPHVGVVVLSQYVETRHVIKLLDETPKRIGYPPDVVTQLLRRHRHDNALEALTSREREILGLMAEGRSNKAICHQLSLSPKTIETHVASIFTKLGLLPAPSSNVHGWHAVPESLLRRIVVGTAESCGVTEDRGRLAPKTLRHARTLRRADGNPPR